MAAHDSSWDAFRAELKRWMDLRRVTNKELAAAVNEDLVEAGLTAPIDEQIVKRWRHSTAPPLQTLKVIARVLCMSDDATGRAPYDPTYLPRTMGVLDAAPDKGELIEAAYRLQSLRAQIADAQETLAAISADEGLMKIVRAAVHSYLGCAVLPVYEGPPGYPMHVCDRIDLRSIVPGPRPDMASHPELHDALQDAFAVPSRRAPRFSSPDDETVSRWAVPYIGRPRSRGLHSPHRHLPAVAITSVTTAGWIDDIGDIVAMVLGYGFTTTRELARELVSNPYSHEELRSSIHDTFLHDATPQRRVWTHYRQTVPQTNDSALFQDHAGRVSPGLVQFFVLEDDDLLRYAAGMPTNMSVPLPPEQVEASPQTLIHTRKELLTRAHAAAASHPVFVIPTTYRETPDGRWAQVFECVLAILTRLQELGVEVRVDDVHERLVRSEPGVAPQVLRWLADHDAPFVNPAFRTSR